jgi:hypothetical protein
MYRYPTLTTRHATPRQAEHSRILAIVVGSLVSVNLLVVHDSRKTSESDILQDFTAVIFIVFL